jgi:UDP-N-acetylmuramoyl-tripeptide--D-alanyl-D-alanine ligase
MLWWHRYFQQDGYDNSRFSSWIRNNFEPNIQLIGATVALGIFSWISYFDLLRSVILIGQTVWLAVIAVSLEDPRTSGKVRLNMTPRASRLFYLALFMAILLVYLVYRGFDPIAYPIRFTILQLLIVSACPAFLMLARIMLQPDENRRQQQFIADAKAKLADVDPFVIGITGSYGKTTTKAYLGTIMNVTLAPTFWPPKSYNTEMGITRELRESLKPGHKYAIIEMGAYNIGSIKRLCGLTPPKAAIVTAVGPMHLERFGSVENVYRAKKELPEAVPAGGLLVLNGDNDYVRKMAGEFTGHRCVLYGLDSSKGSLDCSGEIREITPNGTKFEINFRGRKFEAATKLFGRPAVSNLLASFAMAVELGADPEYVIAAIQTIEQFDNRLEVKRVGGSLQINDAFNSNPEGFIAALDVLKELPGEKKILFTPGMIELGPIQETENARVAEYAAKICSDVIIVGNVNKKALTDGLKRGGFDEGRIWHVATRDEAFSTLASIRTDRDVTLIENDLTDLYETTKT